MLFALHPAECYYNTAIFNSTLREQRQYICHLTKHTKPTICAVIDVLYYCWCWRQEKDNATLYNTTQWKEMCSICLDAGFFSLICPPTGQSWPLAPIQMQKLPPQQAGKQQVRTYPLYSSNERLQVRPEKQLQKYGRLAVPKALPPLRTE